MKMVWMQVPYDEAVQGVSCKHNIIIMIKQICPCMWHLLALALALWKVLQSLQPLLDCGIVEGLCCLFSGASECFQASLETFRGSWEAPQLWKSLLRLAVNSLSITPCFLAACMVLYQSLLPLHYFLATCMMIRLRKVHRSLLPHYAPLASPSSSSRYQSKWLLYKNGRFNCKVSYLADIESTNISMQLWAIHKPLKVWKN